jgi:hypothetical protein
LAFTKRNAHVLPLWSNWSSCLISPCWTHLPMYLIGVIKKQKSAGHRCLMPVILATQEPGIRRIVVRCQTRQIVWKKITKKGWWTGSRCSPEFKPQYYQTPPQKTKTKATTYDSFRIKWDKQKVFRLTEGMAQVLGCLPIKYKALSSNSSTAKKESKKS